LQPRSDIIFATILADTVEFPRAAFTATQTEDGVERGVGTGPVTGFVELEGTGIVEFVGVVGGVTGTLGGNEGVVFVVFAACEICAWFKFSCSLVHSPGAHK
jgi:hypothetical protein